MALAPVSSTGQALRAGFAVRAARGAVRQRKCDAPARKLCSCFFDGYRCHRLPNVAADCSSSLRLWRVGTRPTRAV